MRIIANFGRSLALFVPTFFCLYATDLWALNLFVFISTYPVSPSDRLSGIWYGFMYLAGGAVLYLFVVGLWWLLIKTLWRNSPDWIAPKSWKSIFINLAITTVCLFIAFLCEPALWRGGNAFINGLGYLTQMIVMTLPKVASIWFLLVNIIYFLTSRASKFQNQTNKSVLRDRIPKKYVSRKSQETVDRNVVTEYPSAQEALRDRQEDHERKVAAMRAAKASSFPKVQHPSKPVAKSEISISKLRKLIKMVHGREDVARRLIEGNLKLFPDKSPDWACDKAISDLERDRRT